MNKIKFAFIAILTLIPTVAFAAEGGIPILDQILGYIPESGSAMLLTAAGVIEFLFRLFPTEKPLSIAHVIAKAAHQLAKISERIGDALDTVLPQKKVTPIEPPKE